MIRSMSRSSIPSGRSAVRGGGVMRILQTGAFAIGLAVASLLPALAAADTCEGLGSLALPNTSITLAQSVAPGGFALPEGGTNIPAFCRVTATLAPTSDSDIKIEVWMPAS